MAKKQQSPPKGCRLVNGWVCMCPFGDVCGRKGGRLGWYETEEGADKRLIDHLGGSPKHPEYSSDDVDKIVEVIAEHAADCKYREEGYICEETGVRVHNDDDEPEEGDPTLRTMPKTKPQKTQPERPQQRSRTRGQGASSASGAQGASSASGAARGRERERERDRDRDRGRDRDRDVHERADRGDRGRTSVTLQPRTRSAAPEPPIAPMVSQLMARQGVAGIVTSEIPYLHSGSALEAAQ